MLSIKKVTLFSIIVALTAVPAFGQAQVSQADTTAIYMAALADILVPGSKNRVVLPDKTEPRQWIMDDRLGTVPDVDTAAINAFRRANAVATPIGKIVLAGVEVVVAPDSVIENLGRSDSGPVNPRQYWSNFAARFPGAAGILRFSAIGLSQDGQTAVVGVSFGCGGLCGRGHIAVVRKIDGRWKLIGYGYGWVS
jgi:hypothetical protein